MAVYTTTVKAICEVSAGLIKPVEVDLWASETSQTEYYMCIVEGAKKIFGTGRGVNGFWSHFTNSSLELFIKWKWVEHYFFREIGFETLGAFVQHVKVKWQEILPYYDFLLEQAYGGNENNLLWFISTPSKKIEHGGHTTTGNSGTDSTSISGTNNVINSGNDMDYQNGAHTVTDNTTRQPTHITTIQSDTPQSTVDFGNNGYASMVEKQTVTYDQESHFVTDSWQNYGKTHHFGLHTDTTNSSTNSTTHGKLTRFEDYLTQTITGNENINLAEILTTYKPELFNVIEKFIGEFEGLFMQIW